MKLFDFNGFEKVAEDKHKTTMRHKDGHEIHIAHSALPPVKQEQLRRLTLAKGGRVSKDALESGEDGVSEQGRAVRKAMKTKDPKDMNYAKEEAKGRADYERVASHPKIKGLAHGGEVERFYNNDSEVGDTGGPTPESAADSSQQATPPPVTVNVMQGPSNNPGQPAPTQNPQLPGPTDFSKINPNDNPGAIKSPTNGQGQVDPTVQPELGLQAIDEKQKADAQTAQGQEKILQNYRPTLQALAQKPYERLDDIYQRTDAMANYAKQKPLDPNLYYKNMGAPAKVASLLGMIAGGFKQGMVGGNNPALDMLNQQVQNNIDAQKENYGRQKTIYGYYRDLYGEGVKADAAAAVSTRNLMANDMDQWAKRMGTPQSFAAADAAKANFVNLNAQDLKKGSVNNTILPGAGSQGRGGAPQNSMESPQQQSGMPAAQQGGNNQAPMTGAKQDQGPSDDEWASTPILGPNAEKAVNQSQIDGIHDARFAENKRALNQAQAIDRVLGQTHGVMQELYKNAKDGGWSEAAVRRKAFSHGVPGVSMGDATVGGTNLQEWWDQYNSSPTLRSYESARTRMVNEIANATKGTNLGQEEIQKLVGANLPEYGDPPWVVDKKEKAIKIGVKNAFVDKGDLSDSNKDMGIAALYNHKKKK